METTKQFTDQTPLLVAPHLVLRSVSLHHDEQVVAEVRKFEVMMYGKEEEVIYDTKGQPTKGTQAPLNHVRSRQEGIYLPWIHHGTTRLHAYVA